MIQQHIENHLGLVLFKNAYHLILGTGFTSLFGFLFWILATRLYSTEIIGLVSALVSILTLIAVIAELGLGIGLIRFLPDSRDDGNSLINSCFTLSSLFSITLSLVFIVGLPFWGQIYIQYFKESLIIIFFTIFSIIFSLFPLLASTFLAKRITKMIVYINFISGISKIVLLLLISQINQYFLGLFITIGVSFLIGLIFGLYLFLPKIQPKYYPIPELNIHQLKGIKNYSAVNYFGRLLLQMTPLLFPLMILNILGPDMTAFFIISWSIISIVQVIPSSFCNSLMAECTHEGRVNKSYMKKSFFSMMTFLVPITILILAFPEQILLLFGQMYSDQGAAILRLLSLSVIPWGIIYLYISVERLKKYSLAIIYITGLASFISIAMGYALMVYLGLSGLGIGYLIGQTCVALIVIYLLLKRF